MINFAVLNAVISVWGRNTNNKGVNRVLTAENKKKISPVVRNDIQTQTIYTPINLH